MVLMTNYVALTLYNDDRGKVISRIEFKLELGVNDEMKIKDMILSALVVATVGGVAVTVPTEPAAAAKYTAIKSFPKAYRGTWYTKEYNSRLIISAKKWKDTDGNMTLSLHTIKAKTGTDSWIYAYKASNNNLLYSFWPEKKNPKLSDFYGNSYHYKVVNKTYHGKKIKALKAYGEDDSFAIFSYRTKQQSKHLESYHYYHG